MDLTIYLLFFFLFPLTSGDLKLFKITSILEFVISLSGENFFRQLIVFLKAWNFNLGERACAGHFLAKFPQEKKRLEFLFVGTGGARRGGQRQKGSKGKGRGGERGERL
jgi:hypothetical protein